MARAIRKQFTRLIQNEGALYLACIVMVLVLL